MDLEEVVAQCRHALNGFVAGNPGPVKALFSHSDDVSLANPWGPPWRGWAQVSQALDAGAARFSDGELAAVDEVARYVTPDLACFLDTERWLARVDGSADVVPFALRVTSVFRREDSTWKIVQSQHRSPRTQHWD